MNRLHIVHHGMGSFRPLRAIFLILIGVLMGLGFAQGRRAAGRLVWPKNYLPPQLPSGAASAHRRHRPRPPARLARDEHGG